MLRKLRTIAAYLRACFLRGTGLLWWAKRRAARHGVVVLTLHRVLEDDEFSHTSSLPGIVVRKKTYEKLVGWLSKRCDVIDSGSDTSTWIPARRPKVALTFDDGWFDNYQIAGPILSRHRIPATIFICPELMDRSFPFWPEQVCRLISDLPDRKLLYDIFPALVGTHHSRMVDSAIERLKQMEPDVRHDVVARLSAVASSSHRDRNEPLNRTMTWRQAEQLLTDGIRFGSHTLNHVILTSVSQPTAQAELVESRHQIETHLRAPCSTLAYPNGNHNREICELTQEAGYTRAFTTMRGLWTSDTDPFRIPRINVSEPWLVGPFGRFSRAMAEYTLFWNLPRRSFRTEGSLVDNREPAIPTFGI